MRMIGSPLDIDPSPEHRSALERSAKHRRLVESPEYLDGPEHVLVGGRQTGKTRLAMRWLLSAPDGQKRVLVVPTVDYARSLKAHHGLHYNDDRIISWRQMRSRAPEPGVQYGIDDADSILAELLRVQPHLLTVCTAAEWQGEDAERADT